MPNQSTERLAALHMMYKLARYNELQVFRMSKAMLVANAQVLKLDLESRAGTIVRPLAESVSHRC